MQQNDQQYISNRVRKSSLILISLLLFSCGPKSAVKPTACDIGTTSAACQCSIDANSKACACATDPASEACLCYDSQRGNAIETIECFCTRNPTYEGCPNPESEQDQAALSCPSMSVDDLLNTILNEFAIGDRSRVEMLSVCAVQQDPNDLRAAKIKNQIDRRGDYFSERGSTAYTVQRGDSLSRIAARCLPSKDAEEFIALAYYNNIPVPSNLRPDTVILLPGAKPCEDADSLTQKSEDALNRGDLRAAVRYARRAYNLSKSPEHKKHLEQLTAALVTRLHKEAQRKSQDGECGEARKIWKEILSYDKDDEQASYYLENNSC